MAHPDFVRELYSLLPTRSDTLCAPPPRLCLEKDLYCSQHACHVHVSIGSQRCLSCIPRNLMLQICWDFRPLMMIQARKSMQLFSARLGANPWAVPSLSHQAPGDSSVHAAHVAAGAASAQPSRTSLPGTPLGAVPSALLSALLNTLLSALLHALLPSHLPPQKKCDRTQRPAAAGAATPVGAVPHPLIRPGRLTLCLGARDLACPAPPLHSGQTGAVYTVFSVSNRSSWSSTPSPLREYTPTEAVSGHPTTFAPSHPVAPHAKATVCGTGVPRS